MPETRKLAAWGVHLLTASSAVASLLSLLAIDAGRWVDALAWMAAAMVIDSVDGMLARAVDVRRVLPEFDGALLDNLVDYLGYVAVPAVFLVRSELLPEGSGLWVASAILVASGYQFCRTDAKTADHFFTGFPSFWNVAAFYLFFGGLTPALNLLVLAVLLVGVFVPLRWAYPSRMERLRPLTLALTVLWGLGVAAVLVRAPRPDGALVLLTLAYVPYYVAVSLWLSRAGGRLRPGAD